VTGKPCPKIILDGTHLTLKTEIAFALNEAPARIDAGLEALGAEDDV